MLTQKEHQKYDLDKVSKDKLYDLIKKRTAGIYKDNVDGFVDEFMELTENATYDKSKPITPQQFFSN